MAQSGRVGAVYPNWDAYLETPKGELGEEMLRKQPPAYRII